MNRLLKRMTIRTRARKACEAYAAKHGTSDPKTHTHLIRLLRVSKGYAPFERIHPDLNEFPKCGADRLEIHTLTTGEPYKECPYYLLARIHATLSAFTGKRDRAAVGGE